MSSHIILVSMYLGSVGWNQNFGLQK